MYSRVYRLIQHFNYKKHTTGRCQLKSLHKPFTLFRLLQAKRPILLSTHQVSYPIKLHQVVPRNPAHVLGGIFSNLIPEILLFLSPSSKQVGQGKVIPLHPGVAQRVGRGIALLFHHRGTRRGEWSAPRPACTLPPGKTQYPFYRRLGGPQGRSGRAENLVPTGIRSRTVQPVVSRYTD